MQIIFPRTFSILYMMLALPFSSHANDISFGAGGFDFKIDGFTAIPTLPGNCGVAGGFGVGGSLCGIGNGIEIQDPSSTPFYQGQILGSDGKIYWHTIVGDPASGFAMESYMEMESIKTLTIGSFSGGKPTNMGGFSFTPGGGFSGIDSGQDLEEISGNGWDPLSNNNVDFTGNASGDPTRMVVRQVMGGEVKNGQWECGSAAFCSEFLKTSLNRKPIIRQTVNDISTEGEVIMTAQFELDMSNSSYSDDTQAAAIINTVTFSDSAVGSFDMATYAQKEGSTATVTAGRYTYNDCATARNDPFANFGGGSCWRTFDLVGGASDYDEGSYTYVDGSNTDPMAYNWASFYDPSQNISSGEGSGNKRKCSIVGSARPNTCPP